MPLTLRNSVIKDKNGRTKYKTLREGGRRHFHVGVWLESEPSDAIKDVVEVRYTLHSTFANPERFSRNRNNDFSITFWTWGAFSIRAKAVLKDGSELEIAPYVLQFSKDDLTDLVDVTER
ncbi:MAG: pYEATS domain-containing protein [Pseudomonadota bacterium]